MSAAPVHVIGAGLAGSQAALTIARLGGSVVLHEMRPVRQTAAHRTGFAAELVCSNSMRSDDAGSAPGLLKQELRLLHSDLLRIANETAVPGGTSLTVDRDAFARRVTAALEECRAITFSREEVTEIPRGQVCVLATGPLTADALADAIQALTGKDNLSFFDAVNPVIDAETIRQDAVFAASRYGKGGPDFLNCPLTREQYLAFHEALSKAEPYATHEFDGCSALGCPPLDLLARSGVDTLRFGPMKPVGLIDPSTGREAYAVVQLRRENLRSDSYNIVGFQNRLTFTDQKRIFRMIPGLEEVEFIRFGQAHRNTYICAPRVLTPALHARAQPAIFFAGQLSGVEGYVESIATGLLAGLNAWRRTIGLPVVELPRESGLGALCHYMAGAEPDNFAPVRLTFDLLPAVPAGARRGLRTRQLRREHQCAVALASLRTFLDGLPIGEGPASDTTGVNSQVAAC
jgi:methylenetetrahydrofolate--tRNA-(uracil-5-)-methyltransferase